ncbi:MAG: PAS domain-containing sensor histidine kinase [Deltaproteobacteria bacterium HGW-Deltaproteobacteria-21]|nr:MAG: PAS domain-containing sensor histidine kinase [Deltaproteobacteria bacterium HGW-Deltaproteobacteria-21]
MKSKFPVFNQSSQGSPGGEGAYDEIRVSEEKYRQLFELESDAVWLVDNETERIVEANAAAAALYGYTREELLTIKATDLSAEPEKSRQAMNDKCGRISVRKHRKKDGTVFPVEISASYFERQGRSVHIAAIRDVTLRTRAEEAMRESERRMAQIIEFLPDATFVIDTQGKVTAWNRAMESLTGVSAQDMLGRSRYAYALPFYGRERPVLIDCALKRDEEIARTYSSFYDEGTRLVSETYLSDFKGAGPAWLWNTATPLYDPEGKVIGAIESIRDITAHKNAEEELREAQRIARMGRWELNLSNNRLHWSETIFELFEIDPSEFVPSYEAFLETVHPDDRQALHRAYTESIHNRTPYQLSHRLLMKDGRIKWVNEICRTDYDRQGQPLRSVGTVQDITEIKHAAEERERLQAQLLQAQKMESVGRLAGGVAHDFNNMLGIISGHAELALAQADPNAPLLQNLEEIVKAAQRSSDLVRQLLAFARKQTISPKVLDLNDAVSGILDMLQRLLGEDIALDWLPGKATWSIRVDPSQIHQILANLLINSRDAMPDGGKITIETANVVFDESSCRDHEGALPGEYVLLAVTDTGCGMTREVLERIFDPFFTTKEVGRGTGLGLSTIYGIVKQNNGFIDVYSEPRNGTAIRIYLPRAEGEPVLRTKGPEKRSSRGGIETILVVEDEESLLEIGKVFLERQGYTVLAARSSVEALRLAGEFPGVIHLVMTDVVMPDMNGRELAEKLQALRPSIKSLYMSGYPADVIAHHGVLDPDVFFVEKPFSLTDLAEKVREVLDKT